MATPDLRPLSFAALILAALQIVLPWSVGGRSPTGQVSLVLLLALAGTMGLVLGGHGPRLRPSSWLLLAGVLVAGSASHTLHPDRTVQSLLLLLSYCLAAAVAAHAARNLPWTGRLLLASISASGLLVSLAGILRIVEAADGGLYAGLLTGPFEYPNAAAGFLLLAAGAALAEAREAGRPIVRGAALCAGLISALGLSLTRSHGILLAAAIGLLLWAILDRDAWWPQRRLWIGVGALGLFLVFLLAPGRLMGLPLRLWSVVGTGAADTSFIWRLHILQWAWAMARDHPWWGVGPGAFPVALLQYQHLPYVSGQNPHNLYLELAAEYGLPAAILAVLVLGGVLVRGSTAVLRAPAGEPARRRLAVLVAALAAFAVHSMVDLDWSFPAIATTAATVLGLAAAPLRKTPPSPLHAGRVWQGVLLLVLALAAALALGRYYAALLVTDARHAVAMAETTAAQQDLTWALRLNPLSFPAHQLAAWARLRSGDPDGAFETALQMTRIAPSDPNTHYLAGEVALASGRSDMAEAHFRNAVDRAPFAHLRFHGSLLDALARTGKSAEARWVYERASDIFSPDQVLKDEARCLAPGDRYLLARMSRRAAQLYAEAQDTPRRHGAEERARTLERPDARGICSPSGRPGQTSPEASVQSFWRALREGGWPRAEQFLAPDRRSAGGGGNDRSGRWNARARQGIAIVRIDSLSGGEREARLRYEIQMGTPPGETRLCAHSDLRLTGDGWYLERLPIVETGPCPQAG